MTDEALHGLYGTLRILLHEDIRSGLLRSVAGEAGFDLGMIPDGLTSGGIQRKEILSAVDGQWNTFDAGRKERTLARLADALSRQLGRTNPPTAGEIERGVAIINARILKYGFKFENGGFVPVNAIGEIPA
jgi:hypothetical protein